MLLIKPPAVVKQSPASEISLVQHQPVYKLYNFCVGIRIVV